MARLSATRREKGVQGPRTDGRQCTCETPASRNGSGVEEADAPLLRRNLRPRLDQPKFARNPFTLPDPSHRSRPQPDCRRDPRYRSTSWHRAHPSAQLGQRWLECSPGDVGLAASHRHQAQIERAWRIDLAGPPDGVAGQAEMKPVLAELERDALTWRGGARIDRALEAQRALGPRCCRLDVAAIEDDVVDAIDHVSLRKIRPWQPSPAGRDDLPGSLAPVARPRAQGGMIRMILSYPGLEHQGDLGWRVDWQPRAISAQIARSGT